MDTELSREEIHQQLLAISRLRELEREAGLFPRVTQARASILLEDHGTPEAAFAALQAAMPPAPPVGTFSTHSDEEPENPTSRPYRERGPYDWVSVDYDKAYGATSRTLRIEVQCEDCEDVFEAVWEESEITPEAARYLKHVHWLRGDMRSEMRDAPHDLYPEEANELYALLPARNHTSRQCVRFLRRLATGEAEVRQPNKETEDW